jgi:hypothetical protein
MVFLKKSHSEVSTASQAEIDLLPHDDRRQIIRKAALFSEDENRELQQCGVLDKPSLSYFEACLDRDNESRVFHSSRTADCLYRQWLVLHKYRMLDGQEVPHPAHSQQHQDVQCCRIDDKELLIDPEQEVHARWNRRKILKLEAEILELQSYVERRNSIATLSGEFVDFEITNKMNTILIGRGDDVDVDLSNQIGAGRIHRKHALITVSNEKFTLKNLGHRRVVVNGQQLLQQDEIELRHTSLIQMESIDLLFELTPSRSSTTTTSSD